MKKVLYFSFAGFFCLLLSTMAASAKGRQLRIIYIDNSERGAQGGLSQKMLEYIFLKMDTAKAVDDNTSSLLYISNGDNPLYTTKPADFVGFANRLSERKLNYPYSIDDKKQLRNIIYKDKLSDVEQITIDFYVTNYYLNQELMGDHAGYLLNFFPKELQYVTHCAENNITVNVIYPEIAGAKPAVNRSKCMLADNLRFPSGVNYNFIEK